MHIAYFQKLFNFKLSIICPFILEFLQLNINVLIEVSLLQRDSPLCIFLYMQLVLRFKTLYVIDLHKTLFSYTSMHFD